MGLKQIGKNIVNTIKKAGSDTVHEVARHPGTYATIAAGLATGGLAAVGTNLAKKGIVDTAKSAIKNAVVPKKADGSVDVGGVARNVVGVGTAVEGYRQGRKADRLSDEAMNYARENYDANAPLRASSRDALINGTEHHDLSDLWEAQAGNPYRRKRLAAVGARAGGN